VPSTFLKLQYDQLPESVYTLNNYRFGKCKQVNKAGSHCSACTAARATPTRGRQPAGDKDDSLQDSTRTMQIQLLPYDQLSDLQAGNRVAIKK
jgi:hypothetical protein